MEWSWSGRSSLRILNKRVERWTTQPEEPDGRCCRNVIHWCFRPSRGCEVKVVP